MRCVLEATNRSRPKVWASFSRVFTRFRGRNELFRGDFWRFLGVLSTKTAFDRGFSARLRLLTTGARALGPPGGLGGLFGPLAHAAGELRGAEVSRFQLVFGRFQLIFIIF